MSGQIPTRWPDIEAWFIDFVTAAKITAIQSDLSGAIVRNQKPDTAAPYKQIIIAADYGATITPITRYVRVRMQGWAVRENNSSDLKAAFDLSNVVAYIVQTAPRDADPIVAASVDAGPSRVKDTLSGLEYSATTLLLEIAAL